MILKGEIREFLLGTDKKNSNTPKKEQVRLKYHSIDSF